MRCKNSFQFYLWNSCSQATKRCSTSLGFNRYGTQFPCFWIIPMALRRFEMACLVTPNESANSSCVWLSLQQVMPPIRNLWKFSLFHRHAGPLLYIRITALEALKALTTHPFTKNSLTISTWEHSVSFSRSFLQMKPENRKFLQMTQMRLENWHLRSRINLWCKRKFTNVVLLLC